MAPNQVSDLEIWVDLPSGGISRWLYEDVLLVFSAACSFEATVSGARTGTFEGPARFTLDSRGLSPNRILPNATPGSAPARDFAA